jgi:hypothetical protein
LGGPFLEHEHRHVNRDQARGEEIGGDYTFYSDPAAIRTKPVTIRDTPAQRRSGIASRNRRRPASEIVTKLPPIRGRAVVSGARRRSMSQVAIAERWMRIAGAIQRHGPEARLAVLYRHCSAVSQRVQIPIKSHERGSMR